MADVERRHDCTAVHTNDLATLLDVTHLLIEIRRRRYQRAALTFLATDKIFPANNRYFYALLCRFHLTFLHCAQATDDGFKARAGHSVLFG